MKRTLLIVMVALAVLTGAYGIAWSSSGGYAPPHSDYRTGYSGGCGGGGAACHTINKGSFLPESLGNVGPPYPNYNSFCLSCHNASGEAHDKSVGSPSSNVYTNLTVIDKNTSYTGDSHNWSGLNGNAGTRTPVSPAYGGTNFMPGGAVRCQTCHTGADKSKEQNVVTPNPPAGYGVWLPTNNPSSDQKNYQIAGYSSTKQYLAQYLKVFRSTTYFYPGPTTRAAKAFQIYTGFTYNYQNATITFNRAQGSAYIYAQIGQPYFRVRNSNNAVCFDCHANRKDSSVSHSPGTGVKDNHPVAVKYGYNFGLHSTLMAAPTGNAYLEYTSIVGSRVLCTSCHDPHNAASKNGMILREADGSTLCADCHKTKLNGYSTAGSVNMHNGSKHSSPTVCLDCHVTHGSNNILMIKPVINGKQINFQNFTGARSFGPDTGSGICEACHINTSHHLASNDASGQGHNTGKDCTACHSHSTGFKASGDCTSCHGFPPLPAPSGWATTADKHMGHMSYILNKFSLTGSAACAKCHGATIPRANHNKGYYGSDIIDTSGWGGGTFTPSGNVKDPYNDTCANVNCHITSGTRTWGGASSTACDSCHEYPGSLTNDWDTTANINGHTVRATYDQSVNGRGTKNYLRHLNVASAYNATLDTYSAVTADTSKCGKCHPHTLGNPNHNHWDGVVELAPNGYGTAGGNFNVTVTQTGSQVKCSNVACHFNRDTPSWW